MPGPGTYNVRESLEKGLNTETFKGGGRTDHPSVKE